MSTFPRFTSIRITCAVVALLLSLLASYAFIILMGLTPMDAKRILMDDQTYPIYLNQLAFQSASGTPTAAWFIVNEDSLSTVMSHGIKGYPTNSFSPLLPDDYRESALIDVVLILIWTFCFFTAFMIGSYTVLDRTLGPSAGLLIYRQGIKSVGDPAKPYREECTTLREKIQAAEHTINILREDLKRYRQKTGPIRIVAVSQKEIEACRRLGISPQEYIDRRGKGLMSSLNSHGEESDDGPGRELERTRF